MTIPKKPRQIPCDVCLYGEAPHHDVCVTAILTTMKAIEIYVPHAFDAEVRKALARVKRRLRRKREA